MRSSPRPGSAPVRGIAPTRRRVLRRLGLVLSAAWLLAPLSALLLWAFTDRWSYPDVLPAVWGWRGWHAAVDQGVLPAALRSAALGLLVAVVATPMGAMAGRGLVLHPPRRPRLVGAVLLAPVAVPPFAVVMGLNVVALRLHVAAFAAVVLVLVAAALPYTTYLMRTVYATYDLGFEDEARTLGATPPAVLLRVHLPLVAPALAGAAFLAFLVSWSDYIVTLVIGGGRLVTLPILVAALSSASGNEPAVAAVSLAAVAPPFLLLVATGMLARRRVGNA